MMTSIPQQPAVEVENIAFRYGDRKALDGVSFQTQRGEVFGLLGPNGGGKTTLFRILSTLLPPAEGRALILGLDTAADPLEVRRRIGVVFQNQSLDRRLSVEENLRCQGNLFGLRGADLEGRIGDALGRTSLSDRRSDVVETLSGGLRRRAELAKALLHRPELLLLDEPSTGVDPGVRLDFWEHLQRLRREDGVTILLTTHLLDEAERCDRLAILDHGRLIAEGTPDQLKSRIGGDVISLATSDPEGALRQIREEFQVEPTVVDSTVRFEHSNGAELIPSLMRTLSVPVSAVTVARPSLEDVFIRVTGRRFGEGEEEIVGVAEQAR